MTEVLTQSPVAVAAAVQPIDVAVPDGGRMTVTVRLLVDPVDGARLVTLADASKIMGCSLRTVRSWMTKGLVVVRRTPTGQPRVVVESLWRRESLPAAEPITPEAVPA